MKAFSLPHSHGQFGVVVEVKEVEEEVVHEPTIFQSQSQMLVSLVVWFGQQCILKSREFLLA